MAILIYFNSDRAQPWQQYLAEKVDVPVYVYPDVPNPEAITFALLWKHTPEITAQFPNIQVAMSVGAGVEHILQDPNLAHVACARVIDTNLNEQMAEYVVAAITQHRRNWAQFAELKQAKRWHRVMPQDNRKEVVSILGLGTIGQTVAKTLLPLGYQIQGWSQSHKIVPGVKIFTGEQGLKNILPKTKYLICLSKAA